jgi:hypothetical protein
MDYRHVSFTLSHSDIDTDTSLDTASASCGSWSGGKQRTTWNVDLERLMGDLYKPGVYALRLNQFVHSAADYFNDDAASMNIFMMSGLKWSNSSYSVATNSNSDKMQLIMHNLIETSECINYSSNVGSANFIIDHQSQVRLTIELINAITLLPTAYVNETLPHMLFNFDIYSV